MTGNALEGLRVLIIEDEAMIAMLIEDLLGEIGASTVRTVGSIGEATRVLGEAIPIDMAIVDVNLHGQPTFPVADTLLQRGIPFVFATGYGATGMPERFAGVPVLQKPFELEEMKRALLAARQNAKS